MLAISSASTEYIRVPVASERSGAPYDPTGDTVVMAFLAGAGPPESGDWKTASWDTDVTTYPPTYLAQCLIGPSGGTVTLTAGVWSVWVKITDSPEVPVRRAGQIKIF
jgi:hypothetical protein